MRLVITASFDELPPELRDAYAGDPPGIAGFSRGRIPAKLIDQRLGVTVLPAPIEEALLALVADAARRHAVEPIGRAEIEVTDRVDEGRFGITALVDVRPEIVPPDMAAVVVTVAGDGAEHGEPLRTVRDDALAQLTSAAAIPVPAGLLDDEIECRRQWMHAELARAGTSLADYLAAAGQTEDQLDAALHDAVAQRIRAQLLLDAIGAAEGVPVSAEEQVRTLEADARRAGIPVSAYYHQLVRDGAADTITTEVRRAKALAVLLARISIVDTDGRPMTMAGLRAAHDAVSRAPRPVPDGS